MLNIEEILASAGVSAGAYGVYKIAVRLYQKYYIDSECHNLSQNKNEIVITITEMTEERPHASEVMERKEEEGVGVASDKVGQPVQ